MTSDESLLALQELAGRYPTMQQDVVAMRRSLHAMPELGLHNPRTRAFILDELGRLPGVQTRCGSSTSSVVAQIDSGRPGPRVLLRADTDALPVPQEAHGDVASQVAGISHACGHDAHVAMLLCAARVLADRPEQWRGAAVLVFQAGEEGHDGARLTLSDPDLVGLLDQVDSTFAIHVTPNLPGGVVASRAGTLMASNDGLRVELTGRGGHAALPHLADNPVPSLARLTVRLDEEFAGTTDPLVTVTGLSAGAAHNVIPDTVSATVSVRALDAGTRSAALSQIAGRVAAVADDAGLKHGITTIVSYPPTVNDAREVARASGLAHAAGAAYVDLPEPVMASEDFSYFLQRSPGCMVLLGACPEGEDPASAPACHSPRMRIDDSVLGVGVWLHVGFVLGASACDEVPEGVPGAPVTLSW